MILPILPDPDRRRKLQQTKAHAQAMLQGFRQPSPGFAPTHDEGYYRRVLWDTQQALLREPSPAPALNRPTPLRVAESPSFGASLPPPNDAAGDLQRQLGGMAAGPRVGRLRRVQGETTSRLRPTATPPKNDLMSLLGQRPLAAALPTPKPTAPLDFHALVKEASRQGAERSKDPRNHRTFQGVTFGTDPFEHLEFDQNAFEDALDRGFNFVKGRQGQIVEMFGKDGADARVRAATGMKSPWQMTKSPYRVEAEGEARDYTDSGRVGQGKTYGFRRTAQGTLPFSPQPRDVARDKQGRPITTKSGIARDAVERAGDELEKGIVDHTRGLLGPLAGHLGGLGRGVMMAVPELLAEVQTATDSREPLETQMRAAGNVLLFAATSEAGGAALKGLAAPARNALVDAFKGSRLGGALVSAVDREAAVQAAMTHFGLPEPKARNLVALVRGPVPSPLGALKRTRAWGSVAKADSPEAAMGALRRLNGLSEDEARRTIAQVKASGENVRWKGMRGANLGPLETSYGRAGRKPLRVPEKMRWEFEDLGPDTDGLTFNDGTIQISDRFRNLNYDRTLPDSRNRLAFVRALRHEWFHRGLTPKAGIPDAELDAWSLFMRGIKNDLYHRNQFARYLEETGAEAYGKGSLRDGLAYLTPKTAEGARRMAGYELTTKGIRKDAAKLVLGTGGALGAGLASANLSGRQFADFLDDYEDFVNDSDLSRPARRTKQPLSPVRAKRR